MARHAGAPRQVTRSGEGDFWGFRAAAKSIRQVNPGVAARLALPRKGLLVSCCNDEAGCRYRHQAGGRMRLRSSGVPAPLGPT